MNEELSAAVGEALSLAEADPDVRVVVVTGRDRAFCAGADLKNLAAGGAFLDPEHPEWGFAGITLRFRPSHSSPQPTAVPSEAEPRSSWPATLPS